MDYHIDAIYICGLVVRDPPVPITRQHFLRLFLPRIHDIIIYRKKMETVGKIVK